MTQIQGLLQQLNPDEILIIGNGPSASQGLEYLERNIDKIFVCVNQVPKNFIPFFALATTLEFAKSLASQLPKNIPILVPSSFSLGERFTTLKNSELNYLEGSLNPAMDLEFREDFVLITAIQVLEKTNKLEHKLRLRLFGFDFSLSKGKTNHNVDYLDLLLKKQKDIYYREIISNNPFNNVTILNDYLNVPKNLTNLDLNTYRDVPEVLENDLQKAIDRNNQLLRERFLEAGNGKIQIVAELTNNHLGSTRRLEEMVYACKAQGATIIKIQKRDPETLYSKEELNSPYSSPFGNTLSSYRQGVELQEKQIDFLTVLCANLEIPWFTSVLDAPSLNFISKYKPVAIKAPSTISNHRNFLISVANSDIDYIFISLGGTNRSYIEWIGESFKSKNLVMMQCTSSYPANFQDCNIRVIPELREISKVPDVILGYSSHDPGSLACQLAIALGAVFIEKHVKLGSIDWVHFDSVALNLETDELKTFTGDLELALNILGDKEKKILTTEHHKYQPNNKHN